MSDILLFDCGVDSDGQTAISTVLQSGALAAGAHVGELERRVSDYLGGRDVVALSDMTNAWAMALRLGGVGPGDEVMTLALNCMSSNAAISMAGAIPVWVDIDPETMSMDLSDCERALTAKSKALICYQVAGYPADVRALKAFCDHHGLLFIEDVNNAFGASFNGERIGTVGRLAVLSFYANRQVNGIEGAALICDSVEDAARARRLRRFGIDGSTFRDSAGEIADTVNVPEIGAAASLSNVNARLACYHLDSLDDRVARNQRNAAWLTKRIEQCRTRAIQPIVGAAAAYWVLFARSRDRDSIMGSLKSNGIHCSKLHQRNDRYSGFGAASRVLPGTTVFQDEVFALPIGWWLDEGDLSRIALALEDAERIAEQQS